jgi:hypothetical protein
MEYQLSYFETIEEYRRGQPDSKFMACGLPAAMTIAGGAIKGGRIKIIRVEPADERFSIVVMAGRSAVKDGVLRRKIKRAKMPRRTKLS